MRIFVFILLISCSISLSKINLKREHQYTWDISKQIADSIRQTLLAHIDQFQDQQFKKALISDLNQKDDSKRKLTKISQKNAQQVFIITQVFNPNCDKDGNHMIQGKQLKCLNVIWKSYIPH